MFDFCYYANGLLLVHAWAAPGSEPLRYICFAWCTGAMAATVPLLRLSLEPHDFDKARAL